MKKLLSSAPNRFAKIDHPIVHCLAPGKSILKRFLFHTEPGSAIGFTWMLILECAEQKDNERLNKIRSPTW